MGSLCQDSDPVGLHLQPRRRRAVLNHDPGGERTLAMSSSAPWRFWKFVVNGEDAKVYPDAYQVADGDVIELVYEG
ncbi:MAG: DUF4430 domain-containing protein [Collinsella sp.]